MKGFGWFLIFVGIIWLASTIPADLSLMRNSWVLPAALIILGGLSIFTGITGVKHIAGIAFIVFIILFIRAGLWADFASWMPWHMMGSLTETYNETFTSNAETEINFIMSVGKTVLGSSGTSELIADIKYSKGLSISGVQEGNSITIQYDSKLCCGGSENTLYLPYIFNMLNAKTGAGNIELSSSDALVADTINLTAGVGSITADFENILVQNIEINAGVGSVEITVPDVAGQIAMNIDVGVGSAEIIVDKDTEYYFEADAGLGSIENGFGSLKSSGYDTAENRIYINAKTGVGGIKISKI